MAADVQDRIDRAKTKLVKAGKRIEDSGRLKELLRELCKMQAFEKTTFN